MSMDHHSTHDEVEELLSLYAMDATSPDEARDVERHVARCAACHSELQSLFGAAGELSWAPQQTAMPTSVRAGVLAAIDAADAPTTAVTPIAAARARRRFAFNAWIAAPMAACLLLALVVVTLSVKLSGDDGGASDGLSPSMASTMTGSSHVVRISTRGALDGVHAEYADVHGVGMIVTKGLPAAPSGYSYRVWGVTPKHDMHPMGALEPHVGRDSMALQALDAPKAGEVASIEITLEHDGATPVEPVGPVVGRAEMV